MTEVTPPAAREWTPSHKRIVIWSLGIAAVLLVLLTMFNNAATPAASPTEVALSVVKRDLPEWDVASATWGKVDRDEQGRLFQEARRDYDHQLRAFTEDGHASAFSLSYLKTEDPMVYVDAMFDVGGVALQGKPLEDAKGAVLMAARSGETKSIDAGGRRFTVSQGLVHRLIKVELHPLTDEQILKLS